MEPAAGVTDQNITKGGRDGREFDDNIYLLLLYIFYFPIVVGQKAIILS